MLVRNSIAAALTALAATASTGALDVPAKVRIGSPVTAYATGQVAQAIANGDGVLLEIQPTEYRGGNGFGVAPKFKAVVIGGRVRVTFRMPADDQHCFGASQCVQTPWRLGSHVDITACAESPDRQIVACARGTDVVSD